MLKCQVLSSGEGNPFAVSSELWWIITENFPTPEGSSVANLNSIQFLNDDK